jgi:DNA adenine methylase
MGAETCLTPRRPVLRWHGGKWRLAPWVIAHFPPHRVYVEPFGGAGSVLLQKPRSYAEVYNDLDDEVVTLFRVLRSPAAAAQLVDLLKLTPFARAEFETSSEPAEDPVERARRLVVRAFMGFGSNAHSASTVAAKNGFRSHTRGVAVASRLGRQTGFRANSHRSGTTPAQDWVNYPDALGLAIERLRGVIIEQRDYRRIIEQHDGPDTLIYADPPYLPETRSCANKYDLRYRMYRHEMDRGGHEQLLHYLRGVQAMVVLSGYPSGLYDEILTGWRKVSTRAHADGARVRTECLWLNPACVAALGAPVQMEML